MLLKSLVLFPLPAVPDPALQQSPTCSITNQIIEFIQVLQPSTPSPPLLEPHRTRIQYHEYNLERLLLAGLVCAIGVQATSQSPLSQQPLAQVRTKRLSGPRHMSWIPPTCLQSSQSVLNHDHSATSSTAARAVTESFS
ncbi:hypothetical protein BKA64DRAFT_260103 [Cadophora sp. MPI-SDFR-AT-0126]|nr:hypothetical protein BKA64DRAFT_260103 [Leotiomycetes sp. MPI-SDFR-AT-0126]